MIIISISKFLKLTPSIISEAFAAKTTNLALKCKMSHFTPVVFNVGPGKTLVEHGDLRYYKPFKVCRQRGRVVKAPGS